MKSRRLKSAFSVVLFMSLAQYAPRFYAGEAGYESYLYPSFGALTTLRFSHELNPKS